MMLFEVFVIIERKLIKKYENLCKINDYLLLVKEFVKVKLLDVVILYHIKVNKVHFFIKNQILHENQNTSKISF